ncbi:MAG: hypothetical protein EBT63_02495 [Proteobacteria bacterium]|nr:hypothetical protein [Pseudomonadota bacterium]NCA28412.1 hypothetical protein [Pseudomonadota bacterium]
MSKISPKRDVENSHQNSQNNLKNCKFRKAFKKTSDAIKNVFASRIFLALIFLFLGSLITNSCHNYKQQKSYYHSHHESFFDGDDDFFEDDFFAEFEAMHKRMEKAMKRQRKIMEQAIEKTHTNNQEISKVKASLNSTEDEKYYNYELQILGLEPEKISVLIENGYLIFKANKTDIVDSKNEDQVQQSSNSSGFYYAIFLPEYDEKITPEILKTSEIINVKLAKKLSKNIEKKISNNALKSDKKNSKNIEKIDAISSKNKN